MYIKQIQIQGFKSYRDQTAVSPFSPRHNVVVGRNGSGKSNFFSAIRFVLADQYATLSREERQALLHDSSSSNATTLSAFVELIFDNSDRRFPTNGDEVVLRRTIGLKKDEYSIDRRSASKADVANLLEAAGFSRANPYYIVPQGRITALTNAKDHERLDLLKEVAGTRVYEQRRAESLKIVDDTQAKRAKIADLLEYIEAKISDLDADRAELAEYYKADKERRSLEYTLYQADLTSVATALEKLEEERLRDTELAATDVDAFSVNARQIAQLAERQTELERSAEDAHLAHEQAEADHRALVKSLTNAQMLLAQIADGAEGRQVAASALHEQRITIQQEIEGKEAQLEALRPALRRAQQELAEQKDELEQARAQAGALRAKQARSSQFNSQPERDAYLVQQIEELASFVQSQQQRIAQTGQERAEAERKLAQDTASREEAVQQIESRKDQLEALTTQWRATRQARDEANEQKKDLWNEEVRLQSDQTFAREQLSAAERALSGTVDRATMSGLSAVDRIARQLGLTEAQVHGPLYKLFTVDDRFKLPVEVVAGKSLFHVVVDTDDTAARIIEVMNRERSGRVTFMPLNRLHGRGDHVDFPQASDAVLMIRKIHFDDRYRLAMEQVFGKTIICPNLEIAGAYVRSNKVDAITLDGDRVERKGALSGGFHDPRASRMDAIRSYQRLQDTLAETTARLEQVRLQVAEREQEATQHISDMQRAETRRRQVTDSRGPLLEQIAYQRRQEEASAARVRTLTALEADQQTELRKSQATQLAFEEELQTPLAARLSGEEEALLASLGQRADELARLSTQSTSRASDLQAQLADLEIDLDEDLRRRRDELDARLESIAAESTGAPLGAPLDADPTDGEAAEQNVESLERRVAERATSVAERAGTLDQMTEELRTLGERLETLKARQGELGRSVGRQQKGIERYLAKKHRLQEQRDKTNRSIRDLGVLPEEAFDARYAAMKPERLARQLAKVKDTLKKYAHVNKKAVEQWSNFTKQRDDLLRRRTELEESGESIHELIQVLDQRKDEAIERTFKLVSKNFEEIFAKLVPAGRGRLVMQRRVDGERGEDSDSGEDEGPRGRTMIENYTGVSIKVSFNSKSDEGLRVQQLSGGQKSLVALATVFAIQRCDPAPFYLFDEIDANLDAQYRTAVANMIHELADNAQFITTTFRPELVAVADKHYGVFFNDKKVSTIHEITQADAEGFVEASAEPAR